VFVRGRELTLTAEPTLAHPGDTLELAMWRGTPGDPISLWVVGVNGTPLFTLVLVSSFGSDSQWTISVPVTAIYSGLQVDLRGIAVAPNGKIVKTNDTEVTFQ
jgi:hypothetical protein